MPHLTIYTVSSLIPRHSVGGEKITPGNYCLRMRVISQNSQKIGYSCNLLCNDDVTSCSGIAVSAKIASCIKASTTVERSFAQAVSYALRKLGKPQLSLKEQRSSIKAIYEENDVLCGCQLAMESLCYQASLLSWIIRTVKLRLRRVVQC